jgi:hypothetical protein
MFLRGVGGIPADWGYQVINLVCSRRGGVDVFVFEGRAWLGCAGTQLRQSLKPEEVKSYTRPVPGAGYGLQKAIACTMDEHWQTCKEALLELSDYQSLVIIRAHSRGEAGSRQLYALESSKSEMFKADGERW